MSSLHQHSGMELILKVFNFKSKQTCEPLCYPHPPITYTLLFTPNLSCALCLAHMSERHSGNLSKAAAKLMRTVDVDFNYTRPGTHNQVGRRRGREFDESYGVGISVVAPSSHQQAQLVDQLDC